MTFCAADAILCETQFSIFRLMHDSIPKILLAAYCTIIIEYIPALNRHKSTRPQKNQIVNFPAAPVLRGHSPSALSLPSTGTFNTACCLHLRRLLPEVFEAWNRQVVEFAEGPFATMQFPEQTRIRQQTSDSDAPPPG